MKLKSITACCEELHVHGSHGVKSTSSDELCEESHTQRSRRLDQNP